MIKDTDIVNLCRQWVGTPFKHGGCIPKESLDCRGIVMCVIDHFSLDVNYHPLLKHMGYRQKDVSEAKRNLGMLLPVVPYSIVGGIVLFRLRNRLAHIAIYNEDTIIHTNEAAVVEEKMKPEWENKIEANYIFPGVCY